MKKIMYFLFDIFINNITKIVGITMLFVVGLQIFSRSFMKMPFSWTEEVSRLTFIWYCFLGSAVALKEKQHLGIDYFYTKFNVKSKWSIDLGIQIVTIIFGVIIAYYGWQLLALTGNRLSPVMRISMSYFYFSVPVAGFLFIIIALDNLLDLMKEKKIA